MYLQADISRIQLCVLVRCRGKIYFGNEVSDIGKRVKEADPGHQRVIVDVSELDELRTGDLGMLWLRYMEARARGWRIAFVKLPIGLQAMLQLHSVGDAFEVYRTETDAVAALQSNRTGIVG